MIDINIRRITFIIISVVVVTLLSVQAYSYSLAIIENNASVTITNAEEALIGLPEKMIINVYQKAIVEKNNVESGEINELVDIVETTEILNNSILNNSPGHVMILNSPVLIGDAELFFIRNVQAGTSSMIVETISYTFPHIDPNTVTDSYILNTSDTETVDIIADWGIGTSQVKMDIEIQFQQEIEFIE